MLYVSGLAEPNLSKSMQDFPLQFPTNYKNYVNSILKTST